MITYRRFSVKGGNVIMKSLKGKKILDIRNTEMAI